MAERRAIARYRELGAELRKRREGAGLTVRQLADRTGWSSAKVSRFETGHSDMDAVHLIEYVGHCGIYRGQAMDLLALRREAERRVGYWLDSHNQWLEDSLKALIYHETTAAWSTSYDASVLHGLLQTADYARAWIAAERWRSPESVEECVRIRLERQQILHVSQPGEFSFFIHEQALSRQVGSPSIMHEQLLKILLLAWLSHIIVRVVPCSAEAQFGGSFHLLEYAEHRPLVYLDSYAAGLFLEDPEYVTPYCDLVSAIADTALNGGQSRELIAALAEEYDRGSERDAGHLEEEQL